MDEVKTIALGGEPRWEQEFPHPTHGELTFVVERTPRVKDWLAHAAMQEKIAPGLEGAMAGELAAAVAAMYTFMQRPVIAEKRIEDPDTPGHERIEKTLYDPLEDEQMEFPVRVWRAWFEWRIGLLQQREALKNSSGVTSGANDADSSPATTTSHPTTPE